MEVKYLEGRMRGVARSLAGGGQKTKNKGTARELERKRSKRRKIAELVGGKDSGGEMERKIEIGSVQGSAPTSSVRW